jgi:ribosomal protein L17
MAKTVFDVHDMKLAEHQRSYEEFITSGGAKTLEEYREACGVIRGLALARREVQDLAKNYRDGDDD